LAEHGVDAGSQHGKAGRVIRINEVIRVIRVIMVIRVIRVIMVIRVIRYGNKDN
jgi:hypothetical protein